MNHFPWETYSNLQNGILFLERGEGIRIKGEKGMVLRKTLKLYFNILHYYSVAK